MPTESIAEAIKPLKYVYVSNGRIVYRPRVPRHAIDTIPCDKSGFIKPPYRIGSHADINQLIVTSKDRNERYYKNKSEVILNRVELLDKDDELRDYLISFSNQLLEHSRAKCF